MSKDASGIAATSAGEETVIRSLCLKRCTRPQRTVSATSHSTNSRHRLATMPADRASPQPKSSTRALLDGTTAAMSRAICS